MDTRYSYPPPGPLTFLLRVGHRLRFVHVDHLLQAHSVDNATGVEPTLGEPTNVLQGAARGQQSVSPTTTSQSCVSPATTSQSCVSPSTTSQSCVSPATTSQSCLSTATTSQSCVSPAATSPSCVSPATSSPSCVSYGKSMQRRYPDSVRKPPRRLDV